MSKTMTIAQMKVGKKKFLNIAIVFLKFLFIF